MAEEGTKEIRRKLNINPSLESLLIFKENPEIPYAKLSMATIPAKVLNETISKNCFLTLPRITSQVNL